MAGVGSAIAATGVCGKLGELSEDLDEIAAIVEQNGVNIKKTAELDDDVSDLVKDLDNLAKSEKNQTLAAHTQAFGAAWKASDWPAFAKALEGVLESFDQVYERDCQ
ncbi:MAG: hypothetical protein U1F68_04760 [Gammaproteobacteria bacterium]